ncbi:MAG TPA: PVC-type heme-binding CxxCH protein [Planctomycetota bacterium]|nr:PVC-type heme-binding CxxCH protein [Planctomycetota bacterium]
MRSFQVPLCVLCVLSVSTLNSLPAGEGDLGLRVPPGFHVTLYADHTIANDIYAMTLDSKGRVVVTSQGWIKTLIDKDGDGKADTAEVFATTGSGGMGMCFDGNDLYFTGDNGVWRYVDADGDGKADGKPEKLFPIGFGEHGGHAIRKGPDGFWYIIGGNDAGVDKRHVTLPNSPVANPKTGTIVRMSSDHKQFEVIAHGFRNPYDFDFNAAGDIFTYDSDCERDFFLPWYTPTRIYHVGYGQHHGWRLPGYQRSFALQDFYPDTVDILAPIGRGSPTGVVVYRHTKFPERYRGGVIALDWTFGKVFFMPLQPSGASYSTKAEVFLEPTGSDGFAPTDAAVAPDGALYISIGGRRTRGGVYRVEFVGAGGPVVPVVPIETVEQVLSAPQPLDAWSRARWMPAAKKLGAREFENVLLEKKLPAPQLIRAVEILTEFFGGLRGPMADACAKNPDAGVRARVAWSLGRVPNEGAAEILTGLLSDADAAVRRCALEALADRFAGANVDSVRKNLPGNFAHADKRVRQAAAKLATLLPAPAFEALQNETETTLVQAWLTSALAGIWRGALAAALERTLSVLERSQDPQVRLQAVRLIVLALGDSNINKPVIEVHANYALPSSELLTRELAEKILERVRPIFGTGDERLDGETARLLAMLEDADADTLKRVVAKLTLESSPTWDVHYLIVLSRLKAAWPQGFSAKIANALLGLTKKLEGNEQRTKQVWGSRMAELLKLFSERDAGVMDTVINHPAFVNPGHVSLTAMMPQDKKAEAARKFLAATAADAKFPWSEPLIGLLECVPPADFRAALRTQWSNFALRDTILKHLAANPEETDRDKFLFGVESGNREAALKSLAALEKLPPDTNPKSLLPLLRLLRRLTLEPGETDWRAKTLVVIKRYMAGDFAIDEKGLKAQELKAAYQPVFDAFARQHAALAKELDGTDEEDPAEWLAVFKQVPWDAGDVKRGEIVFRDRGCQTCHAVQGALGPNLAGAANRFSKEDLFEAIRNPSRDVAPLFRPTVFKMKDGQVHTGIIAFDSADGYILQTGATTTVRINTPDILSQRPGTMSLMPNGLLKDLKPESVADLYAYLRSLGK